MMKALEMAEAVKMTEALTPSERRMPFDIAAIVQVKAFSVFGIFSIFSLGKHTLTFGLRRWGDNALAVGVA